MQRPEGDRYLMTQGELESRIQVLLAGTVAEEMIFDDVSTGAQNDLERASEIARSMVMEYGMSRLGRVNYRESCRSPFLAGGGEFPRERSHSEQTAREIDQEVAADHRRVDREGAADPGNARRPALDGLAARLDREGSDRRRRAEADHRGEFAQPADRARHVTANPALKEHPAESAEDAQQQAGGREANSRSTDSAAAASR